MALEKLTGDGCQGRVFTWGWNGPGWNYHGWEVVSYPTSPIGEWKFDEEYDVNYAFDTESAKAYRIVTSS